MLWETADIRGRQLSLVDRHQQGLYIYGLMFNSEPNCLIVFTCLLMKLVIIRVTLVLWVFLYSPTVYDY